MKPVRKAVFPVAGLGTRFLPATKAMPKEMLPVVDRPLIQHVVDEAREAGIEHFIFVTGRNKGVIEDHFDRQFELEMTLLERQKHDGARLPASRICRSPGTTSFTRQQEPLGLGHAVWCARELVGNEPFALLLPDVLVQHERGCLAQMIDAARELGERANIIAVEEVPTERIDQYGVVGVGERKGKMFSITGMVEKPPREQAPSNLIITGRYILQPEILELLEKQERGAGGEIQLTDAMIALAQHAAVLRPEVRRPQLRLRLEDRLPRRQRLLRAGARGHRARLPLRDQKNPRRDQRRFVGRVLIKSGQCPLQSESDRIAARQRNDAMGQLETSCRVRDDQDQPGRRRHLGARHSRHELDAQWHGLPHLWQRPVHTEHRQPPAGRLCDERQTYRPDP